MPVGLQKGARARGFGLTEILIAVALFSTAILYLLGTLTASNHAIKQASDSVLAQDIAERVLENERGKPYASLANVAATSMSVQYYRPDDALPVTLTMTYQVDVTTQNVLSPATANPPNTDTGRDMKRLRVTISWAARYGANDKVVSGPGSAEDSTRKSRVIVMETVVGQP